MTQEHLITPPPELVREWQIKIEYCSRRADREAFVAKVFQLGADYELEACCADIYTVYGKLRADWLRDLRRPKPPSLKEQALTQLDSLHTDLKTHGLGTNTDTIRRALESLPD
jgi:hypothetical protein